MEVVAWGLLGEGPRGQAWGFGSVSVRGRGAVPLSSGALGRPLW